MGHAIPVAQRLLEPVGDGRVHRRRLLIVHQLITNPHVVVIKSYNDQTAINAVLTSGFPALAILMVLASVVGAFYYLRVVWYMYFEEALDKAHEGPLGPLGPTWSQSAPFGKYSSGSVRLNIS